MTPSGESGRWPTNPAESEISPPVQRSPVYSRLALFAPSGSVAVAGRSVRRAQHRRRIADQIGQISLRVEVRDSLSSVAIDITQVDMRAHDTQCILFPSCQHAPGYAQGGFPRRIHRAQVRAVFPRHPAAAAVLSRDTMLAFSCAGETGALDAWIGVTLSMLGWSRNLRRSSWAKREV